VTTELQRVLIDHAVELVTPATLAAESPDSAKRLLTSIGWDFDALAGLSVTDLEHAAKECKGGIDEVTNILQDGPKDLLSLTTTLRAMASAVDKVAALADGWSPAQGLPPNTVEVFIADLFGYLLDLHIRQRLPRARALLEVCGLLMMKREPAIARSDGRMVRQARTRPVLRLDQLGKAVSDPVGLLRARYAMAGQVRRDADGIADLAGPYVADALRQAGLFAHYGTPGAAEDPRLTADERLAAQRLLHAALVYESDVADTDRGLLGVALSLTEKNGALALIAVPYGGLSISRSVGEWALRAYLQGELRPIVVTSDGVTFDGVAPNPQLGVTASLMRGPGADGSPLLRLGSPNGTRLEVGGATLGLKLHAQPAGAETAASLEMQSAFVAIAGGDGDGFLGSVLPKEPMIMDLGLAIDWSPKSGFHVRGGAGLDVVLPLHATFGPVEVRTIGIAFRAGATGADLELSAGAALRLGPLTAVVERIGIRGVLSAAPYGGSLGPLDLDVGFKGPTGIGLTVDATAVKGGGYLYFEDAKKEYAGVLELSIKDRIQVKAIGILNTELPGGKPGGRPSFSLLLIITAQFPPIQLSFGFVLTGIGGMIGVNRTMVTDVLRSGIRTRTLDSVLFPTSAVENAPTIISNLKAVFPPAEARYVFGPIVEIGWGTPTLVRGRLGVILELPEPVRLVILGQLKLALPRPEAAVVDVNLDTIGLVEFERHSLSLDATLYDSKVAGFQLLGDMALRMTWAQRPNLALSVGGLNPRFQPPAGFPELGRLTLTMGRGKNPHLALEAYMAVTSNSVQFGSHLALRAEGGGFVLRGHLGFDCLVILSPFSFVAEMAAGVEVLRGRGGRALMSVHLDLTLAGPTPWHAFGNASFKVLFLKITVGFDVRWGDQAQVIAPPADARKPLLSALADARNWASTLPPQSERAATLGPGRVPKDAVLVHPFGRLAVRQTVVPLNTRISRFANATPADANEFAITGATLNQVPVEPVPTQDHFARGQFIEMSDEERLSADSYELMDSGASLGQASGVKAGHRSELELNYETHLVENFIPAEPLDDTYRPDGEIFSALLGQSAAALSPVQMSGEAKYLEPGAESMIKTLDARYVIVATEDLTSGDGLVESPGVTRAAADLALARHLAQHPEDRDRLQVVAAHEAVAA
jgi:hypothetical protein